MRKKGTKEINFGPTQITKTTIKLATDNILNNVLRVGG
jgi:hypothetical protein